MMGLLTAYEAREQAMKAHNTAVEATLVDIIDGHVRPAMRQGRMNVTIKRTVGGSVASSLIDALEELGYEARVNFIHDDQATIDVTWRNAFTRT